MFCFVSVHLYLFFVLGVNVQMSPFKSSAVKGGSKKGKEPVIDVDDLRRGQRGLDFQWECMTLTCSDLMLHFKPLRTTFKMLHC